MIADRQFSFRFPTSPPDDTDRQLACRSSLDLSLSRSLHLNLAAYADCAIAYQGGPDLAQWKIDLSNTLITYAQAANW
jgi:hypothetical protein